MRSAITITFLFGAALQGCDSASLKKVEVASQQLQQCLVAQIAPGDCEELERRKELSRLKGVQAGIEEERILASISIGEKSIQGDPLNSPYHRITRSLLRKPYYIVPESDNYLPYRVSCPKYDFLNMEIDSDEFRSLLDWESRPASMFQVVSYAQKGRSISFTMVKVQPPCLGDGDENINEEFPIITEGQAAKLEAGEYKPGEYSRISVYVFDTFEAAAAKHEELSR